MTETIYEDKLPIKQKFSYAFANTANGILSGIGFNSLTFFYNVKLGLGANYVSLAWLIFAVWNAINDPIFGFIEDGTKSKLGRRIPYLRYGAFIYGILFIFLWYPFVPLSDQLALFFNLLLLLTAFDTLFTIIGIVTYILPAEMTITAKGRANLVIYSVIIGAIGTILSTLLPTLLLTGDESTALNPLFRPIMIVIGLSCATIIFISSYFIKENFFTQMEETLGFITGLKETFRNKPFVIFQVSKYTYVLSNTILLTGITYYIQYVLGLGGMGVLSLLPIVAVFGVALVFTFIYSKLVPKWGLKKIYMFGAFWCAGAFGVTFFLGRTLATAMIGFMLIGVGFSALLLSTGAMIGDTMDYDEVRTGKRREATYSGVEALITKPAISIANWIFLSVIVDFGFNKDMSVQSEGGITGIIFALTIIPAILFLVGAVIMRYYTLDGPEWLVQKEKLAVIHQQKEQQYITYLQQQGKL